MASNAHLNRPISTNPVVALAAAWLDAEVFIRTGDGSCQHSSRLFGYHAKTNQDQTKVGKVSTKAQATKEA